MTCHQFLPVAIAVLMGTALPTTTAAQSIPASCQPLVDAQRKTITTPHHLYSTESPVGQAAKSETGEMISLGDMAYLLYQGKWMRSPISSKQQLDQIQENIADAKALSCQHVGTESVGGVPADMYTSHEEHEDRVVNARLWVSKANGLVLRIEVDHDTGGGNTQHMSGRYEYANVRAPAGVK